ncbi:hypothetical protein AB5I41_09565 [Sphingomonas sp. MMS24-JH45]
MPLPIALGIATSTIISETSGRPWSIASASSASPASTVDQPRSCRISGHPDHPDEHLVLDHKGDAVVRRVHAA